MKKPLEAANPRDDGLARPDDKKTKGVVRMKLWGRSLRSLGVAVVLFGGSAVSGGVGALLPSGPAFAQSAGSIEVRGNRRVEADTIRSYFRIGAGERLDAVKIDE